MSNVAGDIIEITCNHSDLGVFVFSPKSAEDTTYNLGGFTSQDDDSLVTGNGKMIDVINRERPSFEAVIAWDMNGLDELSQVKKLQKSPVLGDWTITHINGTVHGFKAKPVGKHEGNGNAGTFTLKVAGEGEMEKRS